MLIAGLWLAEHFLFAPSSSYDALLIISESKLLQRFVHSFSQLSFVTIGFSEAYPLFCPPVRFIHMWSTRGQVTQGSPVSSIGSTLYIFSKLHGRGKILPTSKLAESSSSALNCIATFLLLTVPPSKAQWTPYQHHEYTCPLQCSFTDCKSRGIS